MLLGNDSIYEFQEDIFASIFGFYPIENKRIRSPFRIDNKPGCFFKRWNGKLYFVDFAYHITHIDCYKAIQLTENIHSPKEIFTHINVNFRRNTTLKKKKVETKIYKKKREFKIKDKKFWAKYGITKKNLEEDSVFAIEEYKIVKNDKIVFEYKDNRKNDNDIKYCIYQNEGRVKIYSPYEKNFKFIGTCTSFDIGGIEIPSDTIIISKSYKDYRVLKNLGYNTVWLQSENMFPCKGRSSELLCIYKKAIIFFDNDKVGLEKAQQFKNLLESDAYYLIVKVSTVNLPLELLKEGIKDPSDLYHLKGKDEFTKTIKNTIGNENNHNRSN